MIRSGHASGNSRGLKHALFPRCPVNRVSAVISSSEINEDHRDACLNPPRDDIPHEELPVILMGDNDGIERCATRSLRTGG